MVKFLLAFLVFYLQHAAISSVGPFPVHLFGRETISLAAKYRPVANGYGIQVVIL